MNINQSNGRGMKKTETFRKRLSAFLSVVSSGMSRILIPKGEHTVKVALGTPLSDLIKYLESIRDFLLSRSPFNRARITFCYHAVAVDRVYEKKPRKRRRDNRLTQINRRKYKQQDYFVSRRYIRAPALSTRCRCIAWTTKTMVLWNTCGKRCFAVQPNS